MNMVSVSELHPSKGDAPIVWHLFTTHSVTTREEAVQIIEWYRKRWLVEQVFRALKRKGLDIESSQITEEASLKKLAVLALSAAIKIMQLVLARGGGTKQKASDLFSFEQLKLMKIMVKKSEGKTQLQKNPYDEEHLAWASWLIARLGGWKGYKSESPPGPITMRRGLERFEAMFDGWMMSKYVYTE